MKKLLYIVSGIIVLIIINNIIGGEKKGIKLKIINYSIQFTADHLGGRNFKINGVTNIPNGAKININISDENYSKHDNADLDWRFKNLTFFEDSVIVKNSKFTKTLMPSQIKAPMKSKRYKVKVFFDPCVQISSIKEIVGEKGEYLGGKLGVKDAGFTILETSKLISLRPEISYKIITRQDISFQHCKRLAIRIVVPDSANKIDVDFILRKLIDKNKSKWDDITVWAYRYSEKKQVGKIPYTMGMKEYSICKW